MIGGELDFASNPEVIEDVQRRIKGQGIAAPYLRVPKGTHSSAWYLVLPQVFDFFDAMAKK